MGTGAVYAVSIVGIPETYTGSIFILAESNTSRLNIKRYIESHTCILYANKTPSHTAENLTNLKKCETRGREEKDGETGILRWTRSCHPLVLQAVEPAAAAKIILTSAAFAATNPEPCLPRSETGNGKWSETAKQTDRRAPLTSRGGAMARGKPLARGMTILVPLHALLRRLNEPHLTFFRSLS